MRAGRHHFVFGVAAAVLLLAAGVALGVERFPPPDFTGGYHLPTTTTPPPRAQLYEWLDVAALAAALGAAAWLAIKRRSRKALWALMLLSLAYFGFYRKGCICPIGSIQNVALALAGSGYAIPLVALAFFILPLALALVAGRAFCGSVCPLGAIQDAVLLRPLRVPGWLDEGLGLLAYVYLALGVVLAVMGGEFLICRYDPFVGFFRLSADLITLALGAGLLGLAMFIGRPYCRWLCPYAVLLRPLSRISKHRVTITPDACVKCKLCEDACPFGAIRRPEEPSQKALPAARRRVAVAIMLLPVIAAAGAGVGWLAGGPMSRLHYTVSLAERVSQEAAGKVKGTTDASAAFKATGRPAAELYAEARAISGRFEIAMAIAGAFVALAIGLKCVRLSVMRRRTDYEPDRGNCLACGRCYRYCPVELERLTRIEGRIIE